MIAIIGILIALLLPAVQAAREAARRSQCVNNIKQLSLGLLLHHEHQGRFPSGGWDWRFVGDPDRGTDRRQPGGWFYSILPYIEQQSLREVGAGLPDAAKRVAVADVCRMVLPIVYCPTRRRATSYVNTWPYANAATLSLSGRNDYAVCSGDQARFEVHGGASTVAQGDDPNFHWPDVSDHTGICYQRSEVRLSHIKDGATCTYLVGEKYLNPEFYATGSDLGDNQNAFVGYDDDTARTANRLWRPMRDLRRFTSTGGFGSAHNSGWHVSFCDGSVRGMSYQLDLEVHARLGNRKDGRPVDAASL